MITITTGHMILSGNHTLGRRHEILFCSHYLSIMMSTPKHMTWHNTVDGGIHVAMIKVDLHSSVHLVSGLIV